AFLRVTVRAGEILDAGTVQAALAWKDPCAAAVNGASPAEISRTSPDAWRAMIGDALACIRARELEKVVPTTLCKVEVTGAVLEAAAALGRLGALYPECVRFAFQREGAVFLGASPERLIDKRGLAVASDALAGSAPRGGLVGAQCTAAGGAPIVDRREG